MILSISLIFLNLKLSVSTSGIEGHIDFDSVLCSILRWGFFGGCREGSAFVCVSGVRGCGVLFLGLGTLLPCSRNGCTAFLMSFRQLDLNFRLCSKFSLRNSPIFFYLSLFILGWVPYWHRDNCIYEFFMFFSRIFFLLPAPSSSRSSLN